MSMDFKCERCGHRGGFRKRGVAGAEIPMLIMTYLLFGLVPGFYLLFKLLSRPGLVCPDCGHIWE